MAAINFPDSPSTSDTFTVGSVTYVWDGIVWRAFIAAPIGPTGPAGPTGPVGATGPFPEVGSTDLIPTITETFDLGSSDLRWNDLYLSGSTIYLGESSISSSSDGITLSSSVIMSGTGAFKAPAGSNAQRPTASTGMFRFNTTSNSFEGYSGSAWGNIGIPTGGIIMWSGSIENIPTGWALCNGSNGTPDLRNRFVVGAGGAYAVNAIGGSDSVTLTSSQIPAHQHPFSGSTNSTGAHNHGLPIGYPGGGVGVANGTTAPQTSYRMSTEGNHSHTFSGTTDNNTGGGSSHENRPPYYALAYIMKL